MPKDKIPMKRLPRKDDRNLDLDKIKEFAEQAPVHGNIDSVPSEGGSTPVNAETEVTTQYPWEGPSVRDDVRKTVNLHLPEPLYLKLKYVSQKTRISQQEIIREGLISILDRHVEEIEK